MAGIQISLKELLKLQFHASQLDLHSHKRVASDLAGLQTSMFRGRGVDFSEVRVYQPGDDIRMMDWRVTARTGKAHTKVFQEERERPVILITDYRANMFFGTRNMFKSVAAAMVTSLLAFAASKQGDRVGGLLIQSNDLQLFPVRATERGVLPILYALADQHEADSAQSTPGMISKALQQVRKLSHAGALVFIISDFQGFSKQSKQQLVQLAKAHQVVAIWISDPIEHTPPPMNHYRFTNLSGSQYVTLDVSRKANRKMYKKQFTDFHDELNHIFSGLRIPLCDIGTQTSVVKQLHQYFSKNEKAMYG